MSSTTYRALTAKSGEALRAGNLEDARSYRHLARMGACWHDRQPALVRHGATAAVALYGASFTVLPVLWVLVERALS